ncbi:MAG: hypothetical protein HKL80_08330 [Acidimicrobiales bacterium]|nr:hypothetical protein [Acidimicrobiales bacterium]
MDGGNRRRKFPIDFDEVVAVGNNARNNAYFGLNVLQGLTEGIDDFIINKHDLWSCIRSLGPILLGSSMWIDDQPLLDKIAELYGATVVITKQSHNKKELQQLREFNEGTPGLSIAAFPDFNLLAPKVNGSPEVIGPHSSINDWIIPTIRTLGYRKELKNDSPPILHAKLALMGHLRWHDEGPIGTVENIVWFKAQRLWVSSANFTESSRRSLEFGFWTEEPELLEGAERFLIKLIQSSENLDPVEGSFFPELAGVEFDNEAMFEHWKSITNEPLEEE